MSKPLDTLGKSMEHAIEAWEHEIKRLWAREVLRKAVKEAPAPVSAPFSKGRFRASLAVSTGTPKYRDAGQMPSYPIPDVLQVDGMMLGDLFGAPVFVTSGARSDGGYPYNLNVEEFGWGSAPAYEPLKKGADHAAGKMPAIIKRAASTAARKALKKRMVF